MPFSRPVKTTDDPRLTPMKDWLLENALYGVGQTEIMTGYCKWLVDLGLPIYRLHVAQRAFHPKYGGLGFSWTRDDGLSQDEYAHADQPRDVWVQSPLYDMMARDTEEMRFVLKDLETPSRYPFLDELKGRGATDYFATGLHFGVPSEQPLDPNDPPEGVLLSWTSDGPNGFSDADLGVIRGGLPYLGLALKSEANRQMASDLLGVYLGRDAGRRVLSGEIQRGSSELIDAAICYFDLVGFTSMTEQVSGPDMIEMLNDYFGVAVDTIHKHGGNILKFMGDGIMAMFDIGELPEDAAAALSMARDLNRAMEERNTERADMGLPTTGFTLALHAGEIFYGNIGAESRLDFTVIGATVNQAARISGMHRSLGQNIIISQDIQDAVRGSENSLVSLGRYMLRGVPEPMELFTLYEG